ncbi:MAG: hypothetical protein ACK5TO_14385 [Planctomycetaceae bacterium]
MTAQAGNLLVGLGSGEGAERFETLLTAAGARIERIVSWGQYSTEGFWYDQAWDEWVRVVQGGGGGAVRGGGREGVGAGGLAVAASGLPAPGGVDGAGAADGVAGGACGGGTGGPGRGPWRRSEGIETKNMKNLHRLN